MEEILNVERASYRTPGVAQRGDRPAIKSFDRFLSQVADKTRVIRFVTRQLDNPRQATRRKAEAFLKKWA